MLPGLAAAFALGLVALVSWRGRSGRQPTSGRAASPAVSGARSEWPVQVTTHAGLDMHPAMSPQGDAIAFVSDRSGAFEIHVRSLGGGSGETPLTSDGGQNVQPAWSPDGRLDRVSLAAPWRHLGDRRKRRHRRDRSRRSARARRGRRTAGALPINPTSTATSRPTATARRSARRSGSSTPTAPTRAR